MDLDTDINLSDASNTVTILLATYQGEQYLDDQLASYLTQTHLDWALIVSDDGSTDDTLSRIEHFANKNRNIDISVKSGPKNGFAENFFSLLKSVPTTAPYAALSDQDDIWLPHKLETAISALKKIPTDVPCLYCSRTNICDDSLMSIGLSPLFTRAPSFQNALVQSLGGGNTMVLNRAAIDLVQDILGRNTPTVVAHDWWLYQVITAYGGVALYDPEPTLLYRQHDSNLIGSNLSNRAKLNRIYLLLSGRFKNWNKINESALTPAMGKFTHASKTSLESFSVARNGPFFKRLSALKSSGVYRQSKLGNLALFYACLFGCL